jgi:hypothetical protein
MRTVKKKALADRPVRKKAKKKPTPAPKVALPKPLIAKLRTKAKAGGKLPRTLKGHPLGSSGVQRAIKAMVKLNKSDEKARFRQRHLDLASKIIEGEPLLVGGAATCRSAGHCAGAALLFAVGTPVKYLRGSFDKVPPRFWYRLWKVYRMNKDMIAHVISANDDVENPDEIEDAKYLTPVSLMTRRRKAVETRLKDFVGQKVANPTKLTVKKF